MAAAPADAGPQKPKRKVDEGPKLAREETFALVQSWTQEHKAEIEEQGGWQCEKKLIGTFRSLPATRSSAVPDVSAAIAQSLGELLGPKPAKEPVAKVPKPTADAKGKATEAPVPDMFKEGFLAHLHKPGENPQIDQRFKEEHLRATGGKVVTRFPPEPSGSLHIGHCKAIAINFGYAQYHRGICYLRFDDTNPAAEEGAHFDAILSTIRWLGYEPYQITYSSDHFQRLYELAQQLIKKGKAYTCSCTPEQVKFNRGGEERPTRIACEHRDKPPQLCLDEFEGMRLGKYKKGEVTLRMKQDLENPNPQMWDLMAYRIVDEPHHRTGSDWRIYPTYDFTHCLCDSFENISHSLCTTEFIAARESYEWLCDELEIYKPRQSEYGRLSLQGTITSKRKINKLVDLGHVMSWSDPRLYTVDALRRRGVPPGAILDFVNEIGVTSAISTISLARFEQAIRAYLEVNTPRLMMVLEPVRLTLTNVPDDYVVMCEKPLHPKNPALGKNTVPFAKHVYIDRSDFRSEDSPDYFRLAPGKSVGLLNAPHTVKCTSFKTDASTGQVVEILCKLENSGPFVKSKAYIQWVADHEPSGSPVRISETRVFHALFKSDNPAGAPNFLDEVKPNSLEVFQSALIETGFLDVAQTELAKAKADAEKRTSAVSQGQHDRSSAGAPEAEASQLYGYESIRFQGMRTAYFAVDYDSDLVLDASKPSKIILNRIVSLKADSGKNS
ncbi:uncharacterized protein L969DRAFT_17448 [Mixia osmundae IAM 14324]|uniref:glutamine--tRNA ligase n=1 Tax=Mixia osmundae (strain CBS 9802 / IAM 14324 / JCM 22182 / KY 12970) TaxID=764103 RepID=G7DVL9_MIXOS|nr:uncharacterized protein L969DRAFT_17448 [Mixia osmundae IAM 14324]KEI39527.1 hypothetical protein L969DRAFT_17448 [Mixia osmundae IAM 14324]GAA94629.1 hypothetical protein E5Q_01281 [Mixia osmundae IAM 14324]